MSWQKEKTAFHHLFLVLHCLNATKGELWKSILAMSKTIKMCGLKTSLKSSTYLGALLCRVADIDCWLILSHMYTENT